MALHYLALEFGSRIPKHGTGVIVTRTPRGLCRYLYFLARRS